MTTIDGVHLAIDTSGTFTDVVASWRAGIAASKVPSQHGNPVAAVRHGVAVLAEACGIDLERGGAGLSTARPLPLMGGSRGAHIGLFDNRRSRTGGKLRRRAAAVAPHHSTSRQAEIRIMRHTPAGPGSLLSTGRLDEWEWL